MSEFVVDELKPSELINLNNEDLDIIYLMTNFYILRYNFIFPENVKNTYILTSICKMITTYSSKVYTFFMQVDSSTVLYCHSIPPPKKLHGTEGDLRRQRREEKKKGERRLISLAWLPWLWPFPMPLALRRLCSS